MTSTIVGAMTAATTVAVVVVVTNALVIAVAITVADSKYVCLYCVLTNPTVV